MSINSIWDAVRAIAQSLQVATIFPAMLLVLVNAFSLWPLAQGRPTETSPEMSIVLSALTLMISYTLYAFNYPLIRLLEGYKLVGHPLREQMAEAKRAYHSGLVKRIAVLNREIAIERNRHFSYNPDPSLRPHEPAPWHQKLYELIQLESELDSNFPSRTEAVLPTRLGNIVAAFEDYSRTRYGMESIVLWPRLIPILKDTKFLEFVSQEKTVFDFLLNTGLVGGVLGGEWLLLCLWQGYLAQAGWILAIMILAAYVFYRGLLVAAKQWGVMVRVAFDLHRTDLRRKLGLRPTGTFEAEYALWNRLSSFLLYGSRGHDWFEDFISQAELDERSNTAPLPSAANQRAE